MTPGVCSEGQAHSKRHPFARFRAKRKKKARQAEPSSSDTGIDSIPSVPAPSTTVDLTVVLAVTAAWCRRKRGKYIEKKPRSIGWLTRRRGYRRVGRRCAKGRRETVRWHGIRDRLVGGTHRKPILPSAKSSCAQGIRSPACAKELNHGHCSISL